MSDNVVRLDDYRKAFRLGSDKSIQFTVPLLENCYFVYTTAVRIDGDTHYCEEHRREWLDD